MTFLTFTVPGPPLPWKRTNAVGGRRLTPKEQREYQKRIAWHAYDAIVRLPGDWPVDALYALSVVVTPKDHRHGDLSNYVKQVEDALNGVTWHDDKQVREYVDTRIGEPSKSAPGVVVTICALGQTRRAT